MIFFPAIDLKDGQSRSHSPEASFQGMPDSWTLVPGAWPTITNFAVAEAWSTGRGPRGRCWVQSRHALISVNRSSIYGMQAVVSPQSQVMQGKQAVAVDPGPGGAEPGSGGEAREFLDVVFTGILGVDGLAFREREIPVVDRHRLVLFADQVQLDAPFGAVVKGSVSERFYIETTSQLAVDPLKHVAVEGRGHALGIVVGANQDIFVFFQVDPDQQRPAAAPRQQLLRVRRFGADGGQG